jgi:chromosome segregation ATPase
VVCK